MHFWTEPCYWNWSKKNGYENQFLSWQNAPLRSLGGGGYGLQPPVDRPLANLAMGNMCFLFYGDYISCSKSPPNGFPARSSPKNAFLDRAVLLKLIKENAMKINAWVPGKIRGTPLANLAMGNMCFYILQGLSCSKSPPNGFPAQSSPKNAFLNRAVLLK